MRPSGQTLSILGKSQAFAQLAPELLTSLASCAHEQRYPVGHTFIKQGDPGDCLLVILEGTASAYVRDGSGRVSEVGEFRPGDVVGEMALITGEARTADVIARTQVRALSLSATAFHRLTTKHPEIAIVLTNVIAERLGRAPRDGLAGKVVNGYEIVRGVGRGGMAVVYQATRLSDGITVALKMMSHRLLYQPGAMASFSREADALQTLRHNNIARLYDRFGAYRTQFLAMEFCDGEPLSRFIGRCGGLPQEEARPILGQLAEALRYVHSRNLVHHDVKPANVMLSRSGTVKLMDFGIARIQPTSLDETVTAHGTYAGTPGYMAPEQFTRVATDARVDVYGLACLAYELLSGQRLFSSDNLFDLIQEQLSFSLPPADQIGQGIDEELHEFLHQGLQRDRKKRPMPLDRVARWAGPIPSGVLERLADQPSELSDT